MKFLNILTVSVATTCLISCQSEPVTTQYLTPFVSGTILDRETEQPIEDAYVSYTSKTYTKTDSQGHFYLSGITIQSNETSDWEKKQMAMLGLTISKDNYITKTYNNLLVTSLRTRLETPQYVNIGNIYLKKKTANSNDEGEIIEEMTFCQPHESQKEVNCILKPIIAE